MERMEREIPKHCNDLDRIGALENENYRLEEENKNLKEENEDLKQIIKLSKSYEEGKNKLKEVYIKNTAKFLDKKFPKINGFMEEDTLQELRDLGEI